MSKVQISRITNQILQQYTASAEVVPVNCLDADPGIDNQDQRILSAAKKAYGYHCLIVHLDADNRTVDNAMEHRYTPGKSLAKGSDENVCDKILPIIPIRMSEAWMMADFQTFKEVVGTNLSANDLGFPDHPQEVETIQNPKQKLNAALKQIFSSRRRRKNAKLGQYYEPIARQIKLTTLEKAPAFMSFIQALKDALEELHFIEPTKKI